MFNDEMMNLMGNLLGENESENSVVADFENTDEKRSDEEREDLDRETYMNAFLRNAIESRLQDSDDDFDEDDEDDEDDEMGDAEDIHNKVMSKAKAGNNVAALNVSEAGIEKYPDNIDLLADAVRFAGKVGDERKAEHYFKQLIEKSDKREWGWMQFTYLLDYLMKTPIKNRSRIEELLKDYINYLPQEEKAAVAACEFEDKIGNHEKGRTILEEFVQNSFHAPQCAAKLISIYMINGEYEKAKKMIEYYEIASNELQSSTNYAIQLFEGVLVEHALLRKRKYLGEEVSIQDFESIKLKFEKLLQKPQISILFGSEIKDKIDGLEIAIIRMKEE